MSSPADHVLVPRRQDGDRWGTAHIVSSISPSWDTPLCGKQSCHAGGGVHCGRESMCGRGTEAAAFLPRSACVWNWGLALDPSGKPGLSAAWSQAAMLRGLGTQGPPQQQFAKACPWQAQEPCAAGPEWYKSAERQSWSAQPQQALGQFRQIHPPEQRPWWLRSGSAPTVTEPR